MGTGKSRTNFPKYTSPGSQGPHEVFVPGKPTGKFLKGRSLDAYIPIRAVSLAVAAGSKFMMTDEQPATGMAKVEACRGKHFTLAVKVIPADRLSGVCGTRFLPSQFP